MQNIPRTIWAFCGLWLFLVGCGFQGTADAPPTITPTVALPTPVNTPASVNATDAPPPAAVRATKLIVWTIPNIAPRTELDGGTVLANQLAAFNDSHPEIELVVEIKAATGQGSIVSYLEAARPVAPSILPDLVLIPTDQLPTAVNEGLVYPLAPLLPTELFDDLYPVAQTLGQVNATYYGYPYALNGLTHLAYDRNAITTTLPSSWSALIETGGVMVLPANSKVGGDLLLQFYMAQGGALADDANQPLLEVNALTNALRLLDSSRQGELLLPQSNALSSMEEAWLVYQTSKANITVVTSNFFMKARAQGNNDGFASIPGLAGPLRPQVTGWVWAISTADPTRQALAAELLTWLVNVPNQGAWSEQSLRLPSRQAAFSAWETSGEPYTLFLQQELARAEPYPLLTSILSDALRTAVVAITSPAISTPDVIAEQAAQSIRP